MSNPRPTGGRGMARGWGSQSSAAAASAPRGGGAGAPPAISRGRATRGPQPPKAPQSGPLPSVAAVTQAMARTAISGPAQHGGGNGNGGNGNGGNGGGGSQGRGGFRGHRDIEMDVMLATKPASCTKKQGAAGDPVRLFSNYFTIKSKTEWIVYQYRVDFSDEEDRVPVRRAWLRQHHEKIGNNIFDGSVLFSAVELTHGGKPLSLVSHKKDTNEPVTIEIRLVNQIQTGNPSIIQVFNLIVRRIMNAMKFQLVGRNLYDAAAAEEIPGSGLTVWPGYLTSIRQHENNILLCTELSHKVLRGDTAYDLLRDCSNSDNAPDNFMRAIIGEVVLTKYNNKTYRVDDVQFKLSPNSKFSTREGDISFVEYYKKRYNIIIRDPKQPLLEVRAKARDIRAGKTEPILLVPELCYMTGLSDKMRNDFMLMKKVSGVIHVTPENRMKKISNFSQRLKSNPEIKTELSGWGLELSTDLTKVLGRRLNPERIIFGNNKAESAGQFADWTNPCKKHPMLLVRPLDHWVIIVPSRFRRDLDSFLGFMIQFARQMDFVMPKPVVIEIDNDRVSIILQTIDQVIAQGAPAMLMVVVSNNNAEKYDSIKKKCYVDRAISNQVVVARTLKHKNAASIATKVAVQINCKLGGAPWGIDLPSGDTMMVGFDVCHDTTDRSKSFGALVSTRNSSMTSWHSSAIAHTRGEELSNFWALEISKAVKSWSAMNKNTLPTRIIIYRDGVGDGQIRQVHTVEVERVKAALTELYGSTNFKMAYIIVTKRINTRFFTENRQNPGPGTIVDDVVTLPEKYDFFLVSQNTKHGTVSPTSYNVIYDTLGWKPEHIQRITYKMTHLYYNLSSTVRVPAACQYAHKLAFLVSQHLHRMPNEALSDRLYFI